MNELAARNALSKLGQGVGSNAPDNLQVCKMPNNKSLLSSKGCPSESPISSGMKTKRKGWVSLKELTTSTTSLSPALSVSKMASLVSNSFEGSDRFQQRVLDSPRTNALVLKNQSENVRSARCDEGGYSDNDGSMKLELEPKSVVHTEVGCTKDSVHYYGSLGRNDMTELEMEGKSVMYTADEAGPSSDVCMKDTVPESGGTFKSDNMIKFDLEQKSPIYSAVEEASLIDSMCTEATVLEYGKSLQNNSMMKLDLEQNAVMDGACKAGSVGDTLPLSGGPLQNSSRGRVERRHALMMDSAVIAVPLEGSLENTTMMKSNLEHKAAMYNAVKDSPTGNGCLEDIILEYGLLENNVTKEVLLEQNSAIHKASKDSPMGDRCIEANTIEFDAGLKESITSEHGRTHLLKDAHVPMLENVNNDSIIEDKQHSFQKQTGRGKKHMKQKRYKSLVASVCSLKQQVLVIPRLRAEIHDLSNKMVELTKVVGELADMLNESTSPDLNVNQDVTGKSIWKAEDARVNISQKNKNGLYSVKHSETLQNVNDVDARFPSTKKMCLEDLGGAEVLNSLDISDCDPKANSEEDGDHVHQRGRVICKSMLNPVSSFDSVTKTRNRRIFNSRKCKFTSRKIPVFQRYGRRWFAVCKSYRKFKFRMV